jgi:siroheme synthase-like protein
MGFFPLFLDITDRKCVVIGGGAAAWRIALLLADRMAKVIVISPESESGGGSYSPSDRIRYENRRYRDGDLEGAALAFDTRGDPSLTAQISAEAHRLGVPLNVADAPELCDFIMPAIIRRGDFQLAISTSGASPATARILRQELEAQIGPEYGPLLEMMRLVRAFLKDTEPEPAKRSAIMGDIVRELRDSLRRTDPESVEKVMRKRLGIGIKELGERAGAGTAGVSVRNDVSK